MTHDSKADWPARRYLVTVLVTTSVLAQLAIGNTSDSFQAIVSLMVESAKTGRGGFSAEFQQSALRLNNACEYLRTLLNLCHHPHESANRPHFLALSSYRTPATPG